MGERLRDPAGQEAEAMPVCLAAVQEHQIQAAAAAGPQPRAPAVRVVLVS